MVPWLSSLAMQVSRFGTNSPVRTCICDMGLGAIACAQAQFLQPVKAFDR